MKKGVNKVLLLGNLGNDPEVRYMPNGTAVANLSLATSESWNDQQGQQHERTEWHRLTMYRRLAEIAGEYLKKGSQIYVEGKLQTRKWQDQQGQDRYTTEIVVEEMQMLGGNAGSNSGQRNNQGNYQQGGYAPQGGQQQGGYAPNQGGGYQNQSSTPRAQQPQKPMTSPIAEPDQEWDDDIPFAKIGLPYNNNLIHCI